MPASGGHYWYDAQAAARSLCRPSLQTNGSENPLRRRCGDVEDVGADGGEDVGPETAILPLLQQHLGFFRQRRAGDGPAVRELEELPGKVEVEDDLDNAE